MIGRGLGGGGNELSSILEAEEEACDEQQDEGGEANGKDSGPVMRVAQVVLEGGGGGGRGGEGREGETRSKAAAHTMRKEGGRGGGVLRSWLPLSGWRRRRSWEALSGGGDPTWDSGSAHTQEDHGDFSSVDSTDTVSRVSGLDSASLHWTSASTSGSVDGSTLVGTSASVVPLSFRSLVSAEATSLVSAEATSLGSAEASPHTHALSTPGVRGQEGKGRREWEGGRVVVGGAKFGRSDDASSIDASSSFIDASSSFIKSLSPSTCSCIDGCPISVLRKVFLGSREQGVGGCRVYMVCVSD